MSKAPKKTVRCAIYTRKSTEEGLEQEYSSLDAQRDAAEAYVASQKHEGWEVSPKSYDDGGFTGSNMERPALQRLLADIAAGEIDCVIVYKVDRLSRSLLDFTKIVETFDQHGVSFVSVTQQFNTSTSMGRLVLNVLLSFAQFEREMISERIRDKVAASRRRGKWSGGMPLLGYTVENTKLVVDEIEADRVRQIFSLYIEHRSLLPVVKELKARGWTTKQWVTKKGDHRGGRPFTKNAVYKLLTNVTYIGQIRYKDETHEGEHDGIVATDLFQRVQTRLKANGNSGGTGVRNKHNALLKGLIWCKSCGRPMTHSYSCKGNKRYRYYVCGTAMQKGWSECPAPSVPAGEIERFVVEQIQTIGTDEVLLNQTIGQIESRSEQLRDNLEAERKTLQRQLRNDHEKLRAIAANVSGNGRVAGLPELQTRIDTAEDRLKAIASELQSLDAQAIDTADVRRLLAGFEELWQTIQPREQVRLTSLLVDRVDFDGVEGNVGITFHDTGMQSLTAGNMEVLA
ncbi:recombinase family protein [Rhodopirellula sp. SWK7]|uniref:recombinase family protein n=1 Tax=Rhodopirellula sp. SWK7 TaxID=595460 RepID=UPI0002BF3E6D|nr:recombinase family protein [Rhodopirellula sp. SWK7]EMI43797.1 site-specific recombinase, resolvase family protein [Rhodopirellula sp. SWK7]